MPIGLKNTASYDRTVNEVIKGISLSIRRESIANRLVLDAKLAIIIQNISDLYCSKTIMTEYMINEIVEVAYLFPQIGSNEITEAFRLWAAKIIGIDAEMWRGEFTPQFFGSVLNSYSEYRRHIVHKLSQQQDDEYNKKKAEYNEQRKAKTLKQLDEAIMEAKRCNPFTSFQQVPPHWWIWCKQKGYIQLNKEQGLKLFEKARQLSSITQQLENQDTSFEFFNSSDPKIIAGKLAVFKWLNSESFDL